MASDVGMQAAAERLGRVGDLITGDYSKMGHAVGKHAKTEATLIAAAVTGGDGTLSHMGRRGAKLSTGYDLDNRGRRVTVKLRPGGPWVLTESGAKPHTIKPKAARVRGIGSGWGIDPAVYAPGYAHPTRKPFTHPGTQGRQSKRSITRTFGRIRGRATRDWHEAYVDELARIMGA